MGATWRVTPPKPWGIGPAGSMDSQPLGENAGKIPIAKLSNFTDWDIYKPSCPTAPMAVEVGK